MMRAFTDWKDLEVMYLNKNVHSWNMPWNVPAFLCGNNFQEILGFAGSNDHPSDMEKSSNIEMALQEDL